MFSLTLTITHPKISRPIEHIDMIEGESKAIVLKQLNFSSKQICDLKNGGVTEWIDTHGAKHKLELTNEAT